MRRVVRESLDASTAEELARRQLDVERQREGGLLDVQRSWTSARRSSAFQPAVAALRRMAGDTQRCMYCLDSHGTDVEHFWPKSPYPERMFVWTNLLLGCTECGRLKGERFPMENGLPLLLDPSAEDPWEHLDFDSDTGNLTPRYGRDGRTSRKGEATVGLLQLDQREALARVYLRTFRRLCDALVAAMDSESPDAESLLVRLRTLDDHGLLPWCFSDRGARHPTLDRLRRDFVVLWSKCIECFAAAAPEH